MKNLIEAYKTMGYVLLVLMATTLINSPFFIGMILTITVNKYWAYLMFSILLTLPIEVAIAEYLVDKDII